jgi:hypothetical protein
MLTLVAIHGRSRLLAAVLLLLTCGAAVAKREGTSENIIPNGDFAKGNVGFSSELPYIEPAFNCLWGGYYTVASNFNSPQLHRLIAPEPFLSPHMPSKQKVFFANAGGKEPLTLWSSDVKCQPNTRYLITFYSISLTGYVEDGNPPHQVATKEWVPSFQIVVNDQDSALIEAGMGKYDKGSMIWESGDSTSATVKIVRTEFPHGGGLIGIADIEMVPVKKAR